ncbi:MAG: putative membrane protein YphA, DoxX/SURF4 family [Chloroflexi bacterium]|jgi:putative oxidoreductase|nr:MAG: putative membrane protein YphA, DoxX/SURF4 family [Chloroflexota bacterium]
MDWLTEPWGLQNLEWAAVPLRIALGVIFIDSGLGKWRRGIHGTGDWFQSLGFPMPQQLAMGVASLELAGGVLLLLGLGTSWVAIPLAANMVVATWVQRTKLKAPFQGGEVQGYELDVLMALACVSLIFLGAGPASLDSLIN